MTLNSDDGKQLPPCSIEDRIRMAGDWIRPSDDLRPRLIEAAKEELGQRQDQRRAIQWLMAAAVMLAVAIPFADRMGQWIDQHRSPTAAELHQRAAVYAGDRRVGETWGLSEAFNELREMQAEQLPSGGPLMILQSRSR